MKRLRRLVRLAATTALFAALTALMAPARAAEAPTLRVFAASSLGGAFGDIARAFERTHAGVQVQLVLAGSQQLVAQLDQGAAGDVLATADERNMEAAKAKSLLAGAPAVFARNRLALIVPATNPARLGAWRDLERRGLRFVIAADAVPAGHYARALLANLGARAEAPMGWTRRALGNVVSEEESAKGVVAKVQLGEADAGIVYRSDVPPALLRFVRVLPVPDEANVLAAYPIAALAKAPHAELARAFADFVLAPEAQALLARHGFLPPDAAR